MKKNVKIKCLGVIILFIAVFTSCKNEPAKPVYRSIATVVNPDSVRAYSFISDKGNRMKPTNATHILKNGQRIIADFHIVNEKPEGSDYDYDVEYVYLYRILTKEIFNITPQAQDSIGNDEIGIHQMWIGSHFLNVEFFFGASSKTHYINLVSDADKTYDDDKVHLEFRHNTNHDFPEQTSWGLVSFNLRSLQGNAVGDSVKIVIHTNEYNSGAKTHELTYKFNNSENAVEPAVALQKSSIIIE